MTSHGQAVRVTFATVVSYAAGNVTVTTANGSATIRRLNGYTPTAGKSALILSVNGVMVAIGDL